MDRLVIKQILGNEQVTQYYVVSLIGKTLVLLIAPINTIVISYLTKRKERLTRSQFGKAVLAGGGVSLVFCGLSDRNTTFCVAVLQKSL